MKSDPKGFVVRVPKGSTVEEGGREVRIRKPRIGSIIYVDEAEWMVERPNGDSFWVNRWEAELVSENDHRLTVTKFSRGGSPIAGWNWPVWGFRYKCACGHDCGDRDGYAFHLEEVANDCQD